MLCKSIELSLWKLIFPSKFTKTKQKIQQQQRKENNNDKFCIWYVLQRIIFSMWIHHYLQFYISNYNFDILVCSFFPFFLISVLSFYFWSHWFFLFILWMFSFGLLMLLHFGIVCSHIQWFILFVLFVVDVVSVFQCTKL